MLKDLKAQRAEVDLSDLQTAALYRVIKAAQEMYATIVTDDPEVNATARRFDQALDCAILLDAYEGVIDSTGELAEQIKLVRLYECGYRAGKRNPTAYIGEEDSAWLWIGLFDCRETCELESSPEAREVWIAGFRAGQDIGADEQAA